MSKKIKLKIGDTVKYKNSDLIIEEFFVADGIRWVRCSKFRRKNKVTFDKKRYTLYLTDNTYLTELDCIKAMKKVTY
jgi:hypothetical protein